MPTSRLAAERETPTAADWILVAVVGRNPESLLYSGSLRSFAGVFHLADPSALLYAPKPHADMSRLDMMSYLHDGNLSRVLG